MKVLHIYQHRKKLRLLENLTQSSALLETVGNKLASADLLHTQNRKLLLWLKLEKHGTKVLLLQDFRCMICFGKNGLNPHPFHIQFLTPNKVSPFSQWLSRAIQRHGWVVRMSTVSQKVPDNWVQIAQIEAERICETMRAAEVVVLINADETFVLFYPEDGHVIAPEGAKRGRSTNETNAKLGLTGILGMELFSSTVLPPFTVLDGATDGRLSKQWEKYAGPAKVCFQKNHWMDKVLAKKYLSWLKELYPGKKIGLIWDKAAAQI